MCRTAIAYKRIRLCIIDQEYHFSVKVFSRVTNAIRLPVFVVQFIIIIVFRTEIFHFSFDLKMVSISFFVFFLKNLKSIFIMIT